jgi:hypothetical protein
VGLAAGSKNMRLDRLNAKKFFLFLLILTGCKTSKDMPMLNENSIKMKSIPVILPAVLEKRRAEFEQALTAAQKRVGDFAGENGWASLATESFADSFVVFADKGMFDEAILKSAGLNIGTKLPKTYSAALEDRILMAVTPEIFMENFPEGKEDDYYDKLLAHEMAHRLHIRILNGDEEAMGPVWFFEGFAIYAAGQLKLKKYRMSPEEIWRTIGDQDRGDYRKYGYIFRHFLTKAPMKTLIEKAKDNDFPLWLRSLGED